MKLKQFIEEFAGEKKILGNTYTIYRNPTKNEMDKIIRQSLYNSEEDKPIRFIVNFKTNEIFMFSADMTHSDVVSSVIPKGSKNIENIRYGYIRKEKGKFSGYILQIPSRKKLTEKQEIFMARYMILE